MIKAHFYQAMKGEKSKFWIDAMKEEIESMTTSKVWDLVKLLKGH